MRLDGWTWVTNPRNNGGQIRQPGAPPRLVLHSTEVPAADLERLAGRHEWPPHLWMTPNGAERYQTVRLGRSAYALRASSRVETNHQGRCVQIEIHMRAADAPHLHDLELAQIGRAVEQVCAVEGIPLVPWLPTVGVQGYGAGAAQRMSLAQWAGFSGVCLHQHVPDNTHWDTGAINLPRIIEWARYWRAQQPGGASPMGAADTFFADANDDDKLRLGATAVLGTRHDVSNTLVPQVRQILRLVQGLPTDRPATVAEVVQATEDAVDAIVGALDGLEIEGQPPGDGTGARKLLAELIGAELP